MIGKEDSGKNTGKEMNTDGKISKDVDSETNKRSNMVMGEEENPRKNYANWPLTDIKKPLQNDVLYGRGGGTNHHPGNKNFRRIVEETKLIYFNSTRMDKPLVALDIVRAWRARVPPGRFLKINETTRLWEDVGDRKAREKTSQALRENASELLQSTYVNQSQPVCEPDKVPKEHVKERSKEKSLSKKSTLAVVAREIKHIPASVKDDDLDKMTANPCVVCPVESKPESSECSLGGLPENPCTAPDRSVESFGVVSHPLPSIGSMGSLPLLSDNYERIFSLMTIGSLGSLDGQLRETSALCMFDRNISDMSYLSLGQINSRECSAEGRCTSWEPIFSGNSIDSASMGQNQES